MSPQPSGDIAAQSGSDSPGQTELLLLWDDSVIPRSRAPGRRGCARVARATCLLREAPFSGVSIITVFELKKLHVGTRVMFSFSAMERMERICFGGDLLVSFKAEPE